jgi:hypothetical protein
MNPKQPIDAQIPQKDQLQYIVTSAYGNNETLILVKNGQIQYFEILTWEQLQLRISDIEAQGYEKADYLPEREAEVKEAKAKYELALKGLEFAKAHPLNISHEDAVRYHIAKENPWEYY